MGNEKSNSFWEAELPPNYDRVGIENFIRAKYDFIGFWFTVLVFVCYVILVIYYGSYSGLRCLGAYVIH